MDQQLIDELHFGSFHKKNKKEAYRHHLNFRYHSLSSPTDGTKSAPPL
jgi:hypothetical protein